MTDAERDRLWALIARYGSAMNELGYVNGLPKVTPATRWQADASVRKATTELRSALGCADDAGGETK
jgi:hypothetical protein